MTRRRVALLAMFAFLTAACGQTVFKVTAAQNPAANRKALSAEAKQEQKHTFGDKAASLLRAPLPAWVNA